MSARLRELRDKTGLRAMRSLRLFAERVLPEFRRA